MSYIVVWKDEPGRHVSTVVDAFDQPIERDEGYLESNQIPVIDNEVEFLDLLQLATGDKMAVPPNIARRTLGWDV